MGLAGKAASGKNAGLCCPFCKTRFGGAPVLSALCGEDCACWYWERGAWSAQGGSRFIQRQRAGVGFCFALFGRHPTFLCQGWGPIEACVFLFLFRPSTRDHTRFVRGLALAGSRTPQASTDCEYDHGFGRWGILWQFGQLCGARLYVIEGRFPATVSPRAFLRIAQGAASGLRAGKKFRSLRSSAECDLEDKASRFLGFC